MITKYILLWFESPLQSWGYDSKFGRRESLEFPTKSGVLGLLLCAMGRTGEQTELLERFSRLRQTVISFKKKNSVKEPRLHDFQMIGAGYNDNDGWYNFMIPKTSDGGKAVGGGTKLTHRYYLQDAVFAVALEVPEDLCSECQSYLQNPVFPIYLGRKCCVPSELVFQGVFSTETEALDAAFKKSAQKDSELVEDFRVVDDIPKEDFEKNYDVYTLNDIPVQFGTVKKYKERKVTKIYS